MDMNNPGDWWSTPKHYFKEWSNMTVSNLKNPVDTKQCKMIVYGGGDLLSTASKHSTWMTKNFKYYDPEIKIAWGLGANPACRDQTLLQSFNMFGVRNHKNHTLYKNYSHVPCASCLHYEFKDIKLYPKRDVGIIHHNDAPMSFPNFLSTYIKSNETYNEIFQSPSTIERTVDFIKTSKKIISNSFHGCYWALLCNVPVIAVDIHRYRLKMSQIHPQLQPIRKKEEKNFFTDKLFLDYCRDKNLDFYNKVKYAYV